MLAAAVWARRINKQSTADCYPLFIYFSLKTSKKHPHNIKFLLQYYSGVLSPFNDMISYAKIEYIFYICCNKNLLYS